MLNVSLNPYFLDFEYLFEGEEDRANCMNAVIARDLFSYPDNVEDPTSVRKGKKWAQAETDLLVWLVNEKECTPSALSNLFLRSPGALNSHYEKAQTKKALEETAGVEKRMEALEARFEKLKQHNIILDKRIRALEEANE